jgi:hypothetical protein
MGTCFRFALLAMLWLLAQNASAITTFNYHWSDVTCGIVERDGTRTLLPCTSSDAPTFTASVVDGQAVFVTATFNYAYHDDGLRFSMPEILPDESRGRITVFEEAAGIYFRRIPCTGFRGCNINGGELGSYNIPGQLILGINGTPDDIESQLSFSVMSGSRYFPQQIPEAPAVSRTVFFDVGQVITISPAPEPATYALMLVGLAAVGAAARRRRRG